MNFVNDLMADLNDDEGCILYAYDDANGKKIVPGYTLSGHPTIGVGRALDTNGISHSEALSLLTNDIARIMSACNQAFPWYNALDDVRKRAICNMVFQLGIGGVGEFHNMIAAIQAKDWQNARSAMLTSKWANETPERAKNLAQMIYSGAENI